MNSRPLPLALALLLAAAAAPAQPVLGGYGGGGGLGGLSDGVLLGGATGDGSEECRRSPTSAACINESMRRGGQNPFELMGQSPDVRWANPNCTRIPCATVDEQASGPQPFGSAEEARKARDEAAEMGINPADLVVLPNNTVLHRVAPGRYSTLGRCENGPCSGLPQASGALDSQFTAAKEQERREEEKKRDQKSTEKTGNTPPPGGAQNLNPDRPNMTGGGGTDKGAGKGSGGQIAGAGSGGGFQDGSVLGGLSDSITGSGSGGGTPTGGDSDPQAVIKVAGSTIEKPGKLGTGTFEFNAVNKAADAAMGVFNNAPVTTNGGGEDNLNVPNPKPTQAVSQ